MLAQAPPQSRRCNSGGGLASRLVVTGWGCRGAVGWGGSAVKTSRIVFALCAIGGLGCITALAQSYEGIVESPSAAAVGGLPEDAILRIVRTSGFHVVGRPVLRGKVYLVTAEKTAGGEGVQVVVDATTGTIYSSKPDAASGSNRFRPRQDAPGTPGEQATTPRIPGGGPPLPRPRPLDIATARPLHVPVIEPASPTMEPMSVSDLSRHPAAGTASQTTIMPPVTPLN